MLQEAEPSVLYKGIPTRFVKGYTFEEIQGTPASVKGKPFQPGHIPLFSSVGIAENGTPAETSFYLRQISPLHKRSYELVSNNTGEPIRVFWEDGNGIPFMALTAKGNNCSDVMVLHSDTAPSGFLLYGLQESDTMVRILRASDQMRAAGIEAEAILEVIEPLELPHDEVSMPLKNFKNKLVQKIAEQHGEEETSGDSRVTSAELPNLSIALDKMTFFMTIRAMQVSERLSDLTQAKTTDEVRALLIPAFLYINTVEERKAKKDSNYIPQSFSVESKEDIQRYFTNYLPKRAAQNFVKLHKLGLVHVFPHTGNISLVGSFCDLDSVRGEPLGLSDKPISIEDMKQDILGFILHEQDDFPKPTTILEKIGGVAKEEFAIQFVREYVKEMGWVGDVRRFTDTCQLIGACGLGEKTSDITIDCFLQVRLPESFIEKPIMGETIGFINNYINEVRIERNLSNSDIVHLVQAMNLDIIGWQLSKYFAREFDDLSADEKMGVALYFETYMSAKWNAVIGSILGSLGITQQDVHDAQKRKISEKKTIQNVNLLYAKLVQAWRWEDDIASHIENIDLLFTYSSDKDTRSYLEYYRRKLKEQLGYTYEINKPIDRMIEEFHRYDQNVATTCIDNGLKNITEDDIPYEAVKRILRGENEIQITFTSDHSARYNMYVTQNTGDVIYDAIDAEVLYSWINRFREERVDIIIRWFAEEYDHMYIDGLPSSTIREIESDAAKRIAELEAEYRPEVAS